MINSVLSIKTPLLNKFISSKFSVAVSDHSIDFQNLSLYNYQKKHYKILISKYDRLVRKIDEISAFIQKTISVVNQFYIKKIELISMIFF